MNRLVGTSLATQESVPAAFAIAAARPGDPWLACRIAASLGGDSDTIAAMTGAICGAGHGARAFPDAARQIVAQVNGLISTRRRFAGYPDRRATRPFTRLLHLGNVVVDGA